MKQTRSPTITTCATTNWTVAKPSHVPMSSTLPFFISSLFHWPWSHRPWIKLQLLLQLSHSSPAPSNATFECPTYSPFLIPKAFFTHPCMHHEFFRVAFQWIYTVFLAFSLGTRWSGWAFSCLTLPPHLFNWRSPLLHHFLTIRQISCFLSIPSVTLSAAPIKILSRYPHNCSSKKNQFWALIHLLHVIF